MTIQKTLAANAAQLLNRANVVGVGIGYKVKGERKTNQLSVTVLVEQKVPLAALAATDIIPKYVASYPTDVIASGTFTAFEHVQGQGVAAPGTSIGHYRITAGTFGAVVYDSTTDTPLILSNNHVLANSSNGRDRRAYIGDPILHPGPADGGRLPASLIAQLTRFQPLAFLAANSYQATSLRLTAELAINETGTPTQTSNLIDAAVAEPVANAMITPEILGIGKVTGSREAELDLVVQKSGRTTGITQGIILLLNAVVRVSYGSAGTTVFTDQIISDIPSAPGDSGSLVVDSDRRAVGLLFAGGGDLTVCNRIAQVEQALGICMLPQK